MVQGKIVPVPNQVPYQEDMSCASLRTMPRLSYFQKIRSPLPDIVEVAFHTRLSGRSGPHPTVLTPVWQTLF